MAGVGPRYLAARYPDDAAIFTAIADRAKAERDSERKDLATKIANRVGEMLDG